MSLKDVNIKMVMLKEFSNDLQTIIDLYDEDSLKNALNQTTSYIEDEEFYEVNFDV